MPTYYAAVSLAPLHYLTFDRLSWKTAHRLLLPRRTFTAIFCISMPFYSQFRSHRRPDGLTEGRARPVLQPIRTTAQ